MSLLEALIKAFNPKLNLKTSKRTEGGAFGVNYRGSRSSRRFNRQIRRNFGIDAERPA